MSIFSNLFLISIVSILTEKFVEVHADLHPLEIKMQKYSGGTLTRQVPVVGKPNEYTEIMYLNYGSGTAIYKTSYNGNDAAIKVVERKIGTEKVIECLKNEVFILDKLKDSSKSAVELGYIELYDFIDVGKLAAKFSKRAKLATTAAKYINRKSGDSKPNDIEVMAMIATCFEIDLLQYIWDHSSRTKDVNWMRSLIFKIIKALWNVHQRGILHNDVAIQNVGLIEDEILLFDFGISVVYNASANVKDMIYFDEGIPNGVKSVLSWDAVMLGNLAEKYLRKPVDDIISAILSFWSAHGCPPWETDAIETEWQERKIEQAKEHTKMKRFPYHIQNYTNMGINYYKSNILSSIDALLQTLYKKVIVNPTNIDYQGLLKESSVPTGTSITERIESDSSKQINQKTSHI